MSNYHILVLNCGSSSLKFGLFLAGPAAMTTLASGEIARIGQPGGALAARDGSGRITKETAHFIGPAQAIGRVLALFAAWGLPAPDAVGHRLVHGGRKLRRTPAGGVMMCSRSGDLDPGVLLYLVREKYFDATRLEALPLRCLGQMVRTVRRRLQITVINSRSRG